MDDLRPLSRRQAYFREYGPAMSQQAEHDVLIGLLVQSGMIKKDEFYEAVEHFLKGQDERARAQARV